MKTLTLLFLTVLCSAELCAQCGGNMYEFPNDAVKCTNKDYFYYAPSGYSNYSWYVFGGTITGGALSSTNWVSVKWNLPGSSRTVSAYYGSGCSRSFYVTNMPGTPSITGPAQVCHNSSTTFTSSAGSLVEWSVSPSTLTATPPKSCTINNATQMASFAVAWRPNVTGYATIKLIRNQSGTCTSGCQTIGFFYVFVDNGVGTIVGPSRLLRGAVSQFQSLCHLLQLCQPLRQLIAILQVNTATKQSARLLLSLAIQIILGQLAECANIRLIHLTFYLALIFIQ